MESKHRPARPHGRSTSRPSVTKKDVEKAECMVLEAVKMVDAAMYNHSIQNPDKEKMALRAIRDSKEFKTRVEAYRKGLLSRETYITPNSELGKNLARQRIEMQVNDLKAKLQQDMREEQAQCSARKLQRSPQSYRSSTPTKVYNATPDPRISKSRKRPKTPQKASPPNPISKIEKLTTSLNERGLIELSPTGVVHFPRHCDDDDDWERVSQHSTPKLEETPKAEGKAPVVKGLFQGLFGK